MEIIPDYVLKKIEELIPPKKSKVGRPRANVRNILEGILFVLRTGVQWRLLPAEFGKPSTVHGTFRRWIKLGIFEEIMRCAVGFYLENEANTNYRLIADASHTKAPFADWSGKNPTDRGRNGIKKMIITDAHGAPLAVTTGPSNAHDSKLLKPVIKALKKNNCTHPRVLAADSAFDAKYLRSYCRSEGLILIATKNKRRRKNTEKNFISWRWVIERTFGWLAWYRSLKICWCKTVESFLAMLQLASTLQLFRMS